MVQGNGLISVCSSFAHGETITRLEAAIRANGMRVFGRIDHASAAAEAGRALRPTVVLYYGNGLDFVAIIGRIPPIAIDLPIRALVWEDQAGATWVTYDDLHWLAHRHGVSEHGDLSVASFAVRIDAIVGKAASPP